MESNNEKQGMDKGRKGNKPGKYYLNMSTTKLTNPLLVIRDKVTQSLGIPQTVDCFGLVISCVRVTDKWYNVIVTIQFTAVGYGSPQAM